MPMLKNGYEYEKWCAAWLKKHGWRKISVTPFSKDQGLDIIAWKDHQKYGFQCKYYEKPVGNKAVQEAYAGAAYYKCDKAAVITNSSFTAGAVELANDLQVELMDTIVPSSASVFRRLKYSICMYLMVFCSVLFLFNAFHPDMAGRKINLMTAIMVFFSAAGTLITESSPAWPVSSLLLCLWPLIHLLTNRERIYLLLLAVPLLLMMMTDLITLAACLKRRIAENSFREKKEIQNHITAETKELAEKIENLLNGESSAGIHLKEAHCDGTVLYFTYETKRAITEDIPLLVYGLNQFFSTDSSMHFDIQAINARSFMLKLTKQI